MNEDLKLAVETIRRGGIILYPTDTVWGIGCDARNENAVQRIFKLKGRSDAKSMLSLVGSELQLEQTVETVPEAAWMLIEAAVHPVTIIYDHPMGLAPGLVASDGSAGIRLTSDPFCRTLCLKAHCPVVSTSANISGAPTPKSFSDIGEEIKQGVDYIVKTRQNETETQKPSNIIKISDSGEFKIIR